MPPRSASTVRSRVALTLGSVLAAALASVGGTEEASAGTHPGTNGRIAYTALTGNGSDIFVTNSDGRETQRLTFDDSDFSVNTTGSGGPAWSPDGRQIAYTNHDGKRRAIFTIDVATGVSRQVTPASVTNAVSPTWSPDGTRIAYDAINADGRDIFTIAATGGEPTKVAIVGAASFGGSTWSPDGTRIAYIGEDGDRDEIYTVPAGGGVSTRVTSDRMRKGAPTWSPDSSTIAFQAKRPDGRGSEQDYEIYTVPSIGGTSTNITNNNIADLEPSYSPDGTRIAYLRESGYPTNYSPYSFDVVTMPASGGDFTFVTQDGASESSPNWGTSPDVSSPAPGPVDSTAPTAAIGDLPSFSLASSREVTWEASDADGSGLDSFQVRFRRAHWEGGFGPWRYPTSWQSVAADTRSVSHATAVGRTDCYAVRAVDRAGNTGRWSDQRCGTRPVDDRSLRASDAWSDLAGQRYYARTVRRTEARGGVLALSVRDARRIALVVTTCPTCGSVRVTVGGKSVGTVNLRSSTRKDRQLKLLPAFSPRSGKVEVRVPTSGRPVLVDGVGVLN